MWATVHFSFQIGNWCIWSTGNLWLDLSVIIHTLSVSINPPAGCATAAKPSPVIICETVISSSWPRDQPDCRGSFVSSHTLTRTPSPATHLIKQLGLTSGLVDRWPAEATRRTCWSIHWPGSNLQYITIVFPLTFWYCKDSKCQSNAFSVWIRNWFHGWNTDSISLLISFLFLLGWHSSKMPRLRHFKTDWAEIPTNYSSIKYASTDGVGFSIWRHPFKKTVHGTVCRMVGRSGLDVSICQIPASISV